MQHGRIPTVCRVVVQTFYAQQDSLQYTGDDVFICKLHTKPQNNKANNAIRKLLAEYYDISHTRLHLKPTTNRSRNKIFIIKPLTS